MTASSLQGMAPFPGQARCLALGFWPECFRRLNVKGGRRPFPKETRSALGLEGKHVTIQGPSLGLSPAAALAPSAGANWLPHRSVDTRVGVRACSYESRASEDRSSVWLPAWLPGKTGSRLRRPQLLSSEFLPLNRGIPGTGNGCDEDHSVYVPDHAGLGSCRASVQADPWTKTGSAAIQTESVRILGSSREGTVGLMAAVRAGAAAQLLESSLGHRRGRW